MKKIFLLFFASGVMLVGCSVIRSDRTDKKKDPPTSAASETESAPENVTATATENKPVERVLEPAEGTYIYDKAKLLTSETAAACNDYAEWLYENYLINAAVVTADDLGERSPEEFASEAYNEIYKGSGSGLLLLINNATNQDILLKTGSCLSNISADDEKDAFYWSTKEIVAGDYKTAILRLLQLGEKCPQHVFDNGGIFNADQIKALEAALSEYKNDVSILATTNDTDKKNEEILKSYYDRRYHDGNGYMIMLDSRTSAVIAYSKDAMPDKLEEVLKKAGELAKKGDSEAAVRLAADSLKG